MVSKQNLVLDRFPTSLFQVMEMLLGHSAFLTIYLVFSRRVVMIHVRLYSRRKVIMLLIYQFPEWDSSVVKIQKLKNQTFLFSGRLYQVEYAMEAISHAGTSLGILATDGILLAAERRNTNKLLDEVFFSEKIYKLNDDMVCSVAGITSDANVLTNELRLIAQRYLLQYGESIPCEQLVSWLCDVKQAYTQYGGM